MFKTVQVIKMKERIAFTVRLDEKTAKRYLKYKDDLEKKIPNVSHSQTISKIILDNIGVEA